MTDSQCLSEEAENDLLVSNQPWQSHAVVELGIPALLLTAVKCGELSQMEHLFLIMMIFNDFGAVCTVLPLEQTSSSTVLQSRS